LIVGEEKLGRRVFGFVFPGFLSIYFLGNLILKKEKR
jgi:hypothetical protein